MNSRIKKEKEKISILKSYNSQVYQKRTNVISLLCCVVFCGGKIYYHIIIKLNWLLNCNLLSLVCHMYKNNKPNVLQLFILYMIIHFLPRSDYVFVFIMNLWHNLLLLGVKTSSFSKLFILSQTISFCILFENRSHTLVSLNIWNKQYLTIILVQQNIHIETGIEEAKFVRGKKNSIIINKY